ncbi:probable protein S-acyltransferase 22 [Phoenix dactylifera]|uniref:S-acyltransferase n=1 Tax=Phoenix dactylifera TaxID=42345 RepID=A0A8B7BX18_PHODC|nr:probable protein S-acyltransferase 22 [Phoenix dactylifera]
MRKNGWQLPYHPLQVVAIAVFLALGFAFYVFFAPFVGKKLFEYVVIGIYTPLVTCVFFLYVWCAATNPADPGLFRSKKCLQLEGNAKQTQPKEFRGDSLKNEAHAATTGDKCLDETINKEAIDGKSSDRLPRESLSCCNTFLAVFLRWCPLLCNQSHSREQSSEQQMSEDGMFYCSLCKVEVLKYSKHCRVCDKCVDGFDHHCRWLNNCIGRRNYRRFFVLMVSALLLLILQWSIGILVLILCFLERKRFSVEIISKLGSSFSLVPFVVVVASCTFLAMIATLPLAQLFFFHILLIKKGISTYDYIIALREQEQQEQQGVGGQQSPQMSSVSSLTGLSSASSFSAFHRGAWCTPPRLFLEDQFDVVPPEIGTSVNPTGKKMMLEESTRKKNAGTVKISPWTLARLNADEVSKAAAEARKRSKVLQPIVRRDMPLEQEMDNSFGSGSGRIAPRPDNRRRPNKRGRFPVDLPLEPLAKISASTTDSNGTDLAPDTSSSLAPLQLEARSAFRPNRLVASAKIIASSPDSSLGSPDLHPFRISSSGAEEVQGLTSVPVPGTAAQKGIQLSRSTSDGYEASGGEDSDRIPSRIVHRSSNWANLVLNSGHGEMAADFKTSSGSLQSYVRQL